jgi:ABC-type nitrate/sulfonate/bicarbonate transport system ATPase subunit
LTSVEIELQNISKAFPAQSRKGPEVVALRDISFTIRDGEFLSIIGPSGCGKSTLLSIIAALAKPSGGQVLVGGHAFDSPDPTKMAFVFQEIGLFPWRTVLQNVAVGLEVRGMPADDRYAIARKYLQLVGLEGQERMYPRHLSGGMAQRVGIARALALQTKILLMDEPFGSLDEQTRIVLGDELSLIWERTKKTIVFVTHSLFESAFLSDRIVVMGSHPGVVKEIIEVKVPRPRSKEDPEIFGVRNRLWSLLSKEGLQARVSPSG